MSDNKSPIEGMSAEEFKAKYIETEAALNKIDTQTQTFMFNILLQEHIRYAYEAGKSPGVMLFGVAMANTINSVLRDIYKKEGILPEDQMGVKAEVENYRINVPVIDKSKLN